MTEKICRELAFDPAVFSSKFEQQLARIHVDYNRVLNRHRRVVGFDSERFDKATRATASSVFTVSACDQDSLASALDAAGKSGGSSVRLPDCSMTVTRQINIPSHTILEGAGASKTVLVAGAVSRLELPSQNSVLLIDSAENVVVRDLSIERPKPSANGDFAIYILRSDNVMLERLHISGVRVGFKAKFSSNFTIRYNVLSDLARPDGLRKPIKAISFGECDQGSGQESTTSSCEMTGGFRKTERIPSASRWTSGFAFYSNLMSAVDRWGSSSASVGEIAGNVYEFGAGDLKIDDGQFILIHHNGFRSIHGAMIFRLATEIKDRRSRWLGIYENRIEDNRVQGRYLINLTSGDYLYLLDNHYRNNTGRIDLRVNRGPEGVTKVYICPESEEAQPPDSSAFAGISKEVHLLESDSRLCEHDGGRYLFQD